MKKFSSEDLNDLINTIYRILGPHKSIIVNFNYLRLGIPQYDIYESLYLLKKLSKKLIYVCGEISCQNICP